MAKVCVRAFVSGKVQGVWFRQSTKEQALKQGLTGYAKNLPDGRVEALLCGDAESVESVVRWLHKGPELSRVDEVVSEEIDSQFVDGFMMG
ncbi:Acylphosphate phosphohydrolase2C putative [gamma proteobacterium IMCC2047]|nr:Acylphosphate phosphohydrolase2C putative [gamma proteobacterium IMCC2047]